MIPMHLFHFELEWLGLSIYLVSFSVLHLVETANTKMFWLLKIVIYFFLSTWLSYIY